MKESVVGTENRSEFSRRLMRWCVGGGFVEAGIVLLILVLMVFNPYPWALVDGRSPRVSSFVYWETVLSTIYPFYMVVVSVTLGIIALVKHRKNKHGWRHYAIVLLTFVLYYIIWLELYVLAYIPDFRTLCMYVNLSFFICLLIALCLSFVWYLVWLIKLYRNEPIKYWSWKAFGCRFSGFVLSIVPLAIILLIS